MGNGIGKKIIRSGEPILDRRFPEGLVKIFALHRYFAHRSLYCLSIHSFPPKITTLI